MVSLLEKTNRSEGFHQIVDFLNASHIRFALSENPTIYDSYIKQFWQTATVNTLDNGKQEITATVNGHVKTVTIASIRKYLQLADACGLSSLPNTKFFDQLSLMGKRLLSSHKRIYITPTLTPKLFSNMRRVTKGYSGEETPLFAIMLVIDQTGQDEAAFTGVDVMEGLPLLSLA
ncbi:hypothetical protein Tco_0725486 [Tanacetum coccineum]|uniref:Xylulose kinase-1 n=1 Tax=Tanacetum coccineum TaxID=301880 RepID=A0ABQ4YDP7_9ASTR